MPLRADGYRINDASPAEAFRLDMAEIEKAAGFLAIVGDFPSTVVQTEIGIALALGKKLLLAHYPDHKLAYFNAALVAAGHARDVILPLTEDPFV